MNGLLNIDDMREEPDNFHQLKNILNKKYGNKKIYQTKNMALSEQKSESLAQQIEAPSEHKASSCKIKYSSGQKRTSSSIVWNSLSAKKMRTHQNVTNLNEPSRAMLSESVKEEETESAEQIIEKFKPVICIILKVETNGEPNLLS